MFSFRSNLKKWKYLAENKLTVDQLPPEKLEDRNSDNKTDIIEENKSESSVIVHSEHDNELTANNTWYIICQISDHRIHVGQCSSFVDFDKTVPFIKEQIIMIYCDIIFFLQM